MFCSNCGVENKDTAKFCMSCGSPLQSPAPVAPAAPVEVQPEPTYVQPEPPYTQPVQTYNQLVQTYYTQPVQAPAQTQTVKSTPKCLPIIAHLTMLLGALLLVLVLVLPIMSASPSYAEMLEYYSDMEVYDGYTGKEIKNISPVELIGIYMNDGSSSTEEVGIIFLVVAAFFGLFGLLNLLFSGIRKPIPVFIFTTLTFFIGLLQEGCYKLEELVGYRYQWGIGHAMLYIGAVLAIGGGIFYMIVRKKRVRA